MVDVEKVKRITVLLGGYDDGEIEKYSPIIENAVAVIGSLLANAEFEADTEPYIWRRRGQITMLCLPLIRMTVTMFLRSLRAMSKSLRATLSHMPSGFIKTHKMRVRTFLPTAAFALSAFEPQFMKGDVYQ